jgi:RNA recognition motif-containing protein
VQIMTDRGTGKSRGFGFVSMPRLEDADEAIQRLNGSSLHGRSVVVDEAGDRPEQRLQPRNDRWHLI